MQLSLSQCFGSKVRQDIDYLVINKSDLPLLTPNASNTAESLIVAICLQLLSNFSGILTDHLGNLVTDESGYSIDYNNSALYLTQCLLWRPFIRERKIVNQIIIKDYQINAN